jgi:hypothetical protein
LKPAPRNVAVELLTVSLKASVSEAAANTVSVLAAGCTVTHTRQQAKTNDQQQRLSSQPQLIQAWAINI